MCDFKTDTRKLLCNTMKCQTKQQFTSIITSGNVKPRFVCCCLQYCAEEPSKSQIRLNTSSLLLWSSCALRMNKCSPRVSLEGIANNLVETC